MRLDSLLPGDQFRTTIEAQPPMIPESFTSLFILAEWPEGRTGHAHVKCLGPGRTGSTYALPPDHLVTPTRLTTRIPR